MKTTTAVTTIAMILSSFSANAACPQRTSVAAIGAMSQQLDTTSHQDFRQRVDRTSDKYQQLNSIGSISRIPGAAYVGSGFMVSPCLVLTNKHVPFVEVEKARKGAQVNFSVGQTGQSSQPFSQSINGSVVDFGGYDGRSSSSSADWALVKLNKSVVNIQPIPLLQPRWDLLTNAHVITAGFPGNKRADRNDVKDMWGDLDCQIIGQAEGGFLMHNCQTTHGQSGGPLLSWSKSQNRYFAVGMFSEQYDDGLSRSMDRGKANNAISFVSGRDIGFESEGDKILKAIAANKCD